MTKPVGTIEFFDRLFICPERFVMQRKIMISIWGCVLSAMVWAADFSAYQDYVYDANDFAVAVIDYSPVGSGSDYLNGESFNVAENFLGRPTVDTTGDDWYIRESEPVPVNPVYPAFRATELAWLGEGGYIAAAFSHPVRDDDNNPYGIDLIVFGNAFQVIGGNSGWSNGDPQATTVSGSGYYEPGIVSVSQDGVTWYSFTTDSDFMADDENFITQSDDHEDGPFCDSFAATMGRLYDPNHADLNLGSWNEWWAGPANPTMPVDPSLTFSDMAGLSVAEISGVYGYSAGGTGYDIGLLDELPEDPETGLKWIQYVRVDDQSGGGTAELDAVSDVSCCGDWKHPYPQGDLNRDCRVDLADVTVLSGWWTGGVDASDGRTEVADLYPDGQVDLADFMVLAEHWLACTWGCE